ncbi:MAG: glutaredoxin domain-containing protein [Aerococcus sp.]|nr:glutaredoxin domain-containing protein [Aerococcus sp.]
MIKVYSKTGCGACAMTKKLMKDNGIPFKEIDGGKDPGRQAVVDMGYRALPVVVLEDGDHFQGFRPDRILQLKPTR